ncbi:Exoribonuclease, phosphorolytic domain 1 [Niveomyces insectorum RCEF 264]|uniref:Exoribonuclease, phosphorolytic domain 1 n=1 Tax=Niveomyces insectorum RCEF 264 TaxID=1081102 RepID=A0A162MNA8_9HYPO|nr:Exoribonuclease, phosphorolytic domain 1 [Niveomyces insectorum RCEF 264]
MAPSAEPQARLFTLPKADGSATYSYGGYTITASANGPIEAQRRDEDPDEAIVDVVVRPAAGIGGPSERHLESLLQKTLQEIVLVQDFPRCAIQVVLQIQAVPENDYVNSRLHLPGTNLGVLPALIQSAVLALLAASIPMRTTVTATSVAVLPGLAGGALRSTQIVGNFSPREAAAARSTHVFAFSAQADRLLLAESDGAFTLDEWDEVLAAARKICCQGTSLEGRGGEERGPDDMVLDSGGSSSNTNDADMRAFLRSTVEGKIEDALHLQ